MASIREPRSIVGISHRGLSGIHKASIARLLLIAGLFGAWQLSGLVLAPIYISTPSAISRSLKDLIANGRLPSAFFLSLEEMLAGLFLAGIIGIGVGLLMGRIKVLERGLDPLVMFCNATPLIALLPILEVWFGFGAKTDIIFIMSLGLWTMIVNTLAGVRVVRRGLQDVGVSLGMSGWSQTWRVYLPAALPFIFAGARIALAQGTVGMILAGQEAGQTGLGGLVNIFSNFLETADLIAVVTTTTLLAMLLFLALRLLQDAAFPWIRATSAGSRGGRR